MWWGRDGSVRPGLSSCTLTDSFSRGYDPFTHVCEARPLTVVGWTSLSVSLSLSLSLSSVACVEFGVLVFTEMVIRLWSCLELFLKEGRHGKCMSLEQQECLLIRLLKLGVMDEILPLRIKDALLEAYNQIQDEIVLLMEERRPGNSCQVPVPQVAEETPEVIGFFTRNWRGDTAHPTRTRFRARQTV